MTNYHDYPVRNSGSLQNLLFLHSPLFCFQSSPWKCQFSLNSTYLLASLSLILYTGICSPHYAPITLFPSLTPRFSRPPPAQEWDGIRGLHPPRAHTFLVGWNVERTTSKGYRARPGHPHNRGVRGRRGLKSRRTGLKGNTRIGRGGCLRREVRTPESQDQRGRGVSSARMAGATAGTARARPRRARIHLTERGEGA